MSSNIPWEECIIFHFRDKLSSILSIFCVISIDWMCGHCSEKRGLFLMKWDSQMASKFAMSLEDETTQIVYRFCFSCVTKKYQRFLYSKNMDGKFWSISLGHFIKHKPLISEECLAVLDKNHHLGTACN